MSQSSFGDDGVYYAGFMNKELSVRDRKLSTMETKIEQLLLSYDQDLPKKVERTFKQWNQILRDYLRAETALRLSVGEEQQAVPVKIVAGLPDPLRNIIDGTEDFLLWELSLYRSLFQRTVEGLEVIERTYDRIMTWNRTKAWTDNPTHEDVERMIQFVSRLRQVIEEAHIIEQIMRIERDILGAYYFNVPVIHLYWMAIGLVALMLDVSIEGLTVVVLTHELVHAYTHLGKDIDGASWDTSAFSKSDLRIVEGLAQYYTGVICEKKLDLRFPQADDAYQKLLEKQTGPYRVHENWAPEDKKAGEIVRFAMINTRLNRLAEYDAFLRELEMTRQSLRRQNMRNAST